jgi:hypothetical protein
LEPELAMFQLRRLTQNSSQGIIGQVPTLMRVRAPGSLQATLNRLEEKHVLDREIPQELIRAALETCTRVPAGTMLDVVKVPLWMLGDYDCSKKSVLKAARAAKLSYEDNVWLPFAMIDQGHKEGNADFLFDMSARFDRYSLTASPGSSNQVSGDWADHWFLFSGNSHCFVR